MMSTINHVQQLATVTLVPLYCGSCFISNLLVLIAIAKDEDVSGNNVITFRVLALTMEQFCILWKALVYTVVDYLCFQKGLYSFSCLCKTSYSS